MDSSFQKRKALWMSVLTVPLSHEELTGLITNGVLKLLYRSGKVVSGKIASNSGEGKLW